MSKVPIDRVRIYNEPPPSAIPALRKMLHGKVPRDGTPDTSIPAMTKVHIAAKQVVHFLHYTGRWPK